MEGAGGAAAHRLDLLDQQRRRVQSRALQLLQRDEQPSALRAVRLRRQERQRAQHRGNGRVRLFTGDLGPALSHEHDLRRRAAWRRRVFAVRAYDRAVVPCSSAAREGEPGRPRVQILEDDRVVGIYIDDRFIKDGLVDTTSMRPIARLGYMDYSVVTPETQFTIFRPKVDEEGNIIDVPRAAE